MRTKAQRLVLCLFVLTLPGCRDETAVEESSRRSAGHKPPNVVLIVTDDLGYCDTGLYDCGEIPTPNIDSLAADGVRFTHGYVTSPVCSPSRAAFMTGRYQQRFGYEFTPGGLRTSIEEELGLPVEEKTLADLLATQGYATGMVGKWHLGMVEQFHPLERGFDEFFGFLFVGHPYLSDRASYDLGGDNVLLRGKEPVFEESYLTDAFTREAVDFITRHRQEPFFLYLSYNAPHVPYHALDRDLAEFDHIENETRRTYAAMVAALDRGVGQLLQALDSAGLGDDTLVWFLSDNGCAFFHRGCTNGPLRLGKMFLFEGGTRVPFILRWPRGLKAGQTYSQPVSALDLVPTLAAVAGASPPEDRPLDGVNLLPFLLGERTDPPHPALFWQAGPNGAVRSQEWKLVFDEDQEWLFHLGHDIGETQNLAPTRPEVVQRLRQLHDAWDGEMAEPLWPGRHIQFPPGQLPPEADGVEIHI